MKHLFYIHSHITYIVTLSVVAELGLNGDDMVFLIGRGFSYPDTVNIRTVNVPHALMQLSQVPSYGEPLLLVRRGRQIAAFDQVIKQSVENSAFKAYLPLSKNYMMQLIATHGLCQDVNYVEEGLLSYTGQVRKQTHPYFANSVRGRLARTMRFLNHGNRSLYYFHYPHTLPAPVYMIHAPLAPASDLDYRVLQTVVVPEVADRYICQGGYLFVIETVVEDGITSIWVLVETLERFIDDHGLDENDIVWVRFRPGVAASPEILSMFTRKSLRVSVIPDDVCVESMLYYSSDLKVIGLHSSLLFYASIWGHKSYSLLQTLYDTDSQARDKYEAYMTIPAEFFQRVLVA